MYKKISTLGMPREEWLRLRKQGIGGSDAGAICGLNPYSSPLSVYRDKTSAEINEEDNESMRIGRDLEDYVAARFCEETGLKVRKSNYMYQSVEHPFMLADVDRLVIGEDAGLECKTVSPYSADKWAAGRVPESYLLQSYHYMAVLSKKTWYIAALILGQEFIYRKITWDDEIIRNLIQIEDAFWTNHVVPKIMPSPDGSDASAEAIRGYFPVAKEKRKISLVGFDEKLKRRGELVDQIKALDLEKKQIEQEIQIFMKDSEQAVNEDYRISWTNTRTSSIDTKRLKEEKPEVYEAFLKTSSSRRFQIKAA